MHLGLLKDMNLDTQNILVYYFEHSLFKLKMFFVFKLLNNFNFIFIILALCLHVHSISYRQFILPHHLTFGYILNTNSQKTSLPI